MEYSVSPEWTIYCIQPAGGPLHGMGDGLGVGDFVGVSEVAGWGTYRSVPGTRVSIIRQFAAMSSCFVV